jgi:ribosome modulation factor
VTSNCRSLNPTQRDLLGVTLEPPQQQPATSTHDKPRHHHSLPAGAGAGLSNFSKKHLTVRHSTLLEQDVRKHSNTANNIHALLHEAMHAIETGHKRQMEIAFSTAWSIERQHIRNGGQHYPMRWFVEIARQYPTALDARPDIVQFIDDFETQQRSRTRGKRDFTLGYSRHDNPYCGYTQSDQYECWYDGWDEAADIKIDSLPEEDLEPIGVEV